jgi:hypothetical protein
MTLFHKPAVAAADRASLPMDPSVGPAPWPVPVIVGLALAGLISPLITFAGAAAAYGLADQDQGTILTGAGLVHMILALTFVAGA